MGPESKQQRHKPELEKPYIIRISPSGAELPAQQAKLLVSRHIEPSRQKYARPVGRYHQYQP